MDNLKLHHIGVATKSIEKEFAIFKKIGYKQCSDIFIDEIQKIKGMFVEAENQPCLELLENLSDDGPLTNHLKKGNKFYHFAYETNNIEEDYERFISNGAIPVVRITKATYFNRICFLMLKNMMLVELVENIKNGNRG